MWNEIGFIASSKYREKIFLELNLNESSPKDLSDLTDIALPNITRALKELEERGLVECLNPDFKKGRLYASTEMGKQIFKAIEEGSKIHISYYLSGRMRKKIEMALRNNGIKYEKNHKFKASLISPIIVDYFISGKNKNIAIIDSFMKIPAPDLFHRIGFESGEIKKNCKDITIVLFLGGGIQFDERTIKLKEHGYVDEIFSEGEEERLVEFIKKYES